MGDAMENIEEAMLQLLENLSLLRDPAFRVFTLNKWPCLNEFYQSRIEKKKHDVFLADIEIERIFECADEFEHLIDQLVVCNARGILKALYQNAHKFLTSCDGIYASEKWNATMIEETKHCVADNIYLAESHLGRVDYHWRRGLNFHMSTVSGLVMAMYGNLFFGQLPSYWTKEHTKAFIAMTKKHYSSFMVEEKERKGKQDLARAKMLREKELKAEEKLVRNSLSQISYFTIPTLQTIRSPKQLEAALGTLRSMTKKLDFLKLFINMYAIGFGFDIPLKFSNSKDKAVGSYGDLIARAKHILTQKHTIPDIPPLQKGCQSTPSKFGLTLVKEWTTLPVKSIKLRLRTK
jgi:hypothetical protein